MTRVHTVSNREYHPAGDIGKHFGYTRDYILMLTRDGKIDGKKIGHRWYINFDSAQKFFDEAKVERDVRKKQIREERLRELEQHGVKVVARERVGRAVPVLAVSLLTAVMFVALLVSAVPSSQSGTAILSAEDTPSLWEEFAQSVYDFFTFTTEDVSTEGEGHVQIAEIENREVLAPKEAGDGTVTTTRTVHTSLVIGPDETMTVTDVEEIRESFSDDVSVSIDPHNPDTGIIVPHFKDGDGEAYRFLMVPVDEDDTP